MKWSPRLPIGVWAACATGTIAVLCSAQAAATDTVIIHILNEGDAGQYVKEGDQSPRPVDVLVGSTVVWRNDARKSHHTATAYGKEAAFDTGQVDPGKSSRPISFDRKVFERFKGKAKGFVEISYHCINHPRMRGKLRLIDGPAVKLADTRTSATRAANTYNVNIVSVDAGFDPSTIQVRVNDTITWTNIDSSTDHTATCSNPQIFDKTVARSGGMQSVTFTSQMYQMAGGTGGQAVGLSYHCTIHPDMPGATITLSP